VNPGTWNIIFSLDMEIWFIVAPHPSKPLVSQAGTIIPVWIAEKIEEETGDQRISSSNC